MGERPRPFYRMIIVCVFFIATVAFYILLPRYWHDVPEIFKHLLLVLSAIMCIHIIEYAFFWWEIFGHMKGILKETLQSTNQLIDDNKQSIEKLLHSSNQLIDSATTCGLTNIYCYRKAAKSDIYSAIKNARKRLWLLGIAHSEIVQLDEILSDIDDKIISNADVKILLFDAFQVAAVFRTFVESPVSEVAMVLNTDRTKKQPSDPYFHQRLFSDFAHAYDRFRLCPNFVDAVRFYKLSPNCWLIIIDDTVYFQPYLIGQSPSKSAKNLKTGAQMPLFKFQLKSDVMTFKLLEEHFIKLWATADMDLFHAEAKIADRDHHIKNVFDLHSEWFKQVYGVINASRENGCCELDRRKFPRQPWILNQPTLKFYLVDGKKHITSELIYDYSRNGIAVQIDITSGMNKGQILCLQGTTTSESLQARFIMNHFLKMKNFIVKRIVDGSQSIVGLHAISEAGKGLPI